jgi:hypothetical protein
MSELNSKWFCFPKLPAYIFWGKTGKKFWLCFLCATPQELTLLKIKTTECELLSQIKTTSILCADSHLMASIVTYHPETKSKAILGSCTKSTLNCSDNSQENSNTISIAALPAFQRRILYVSFNVETGL